VAKPGARKPAASGDELKVKLVDATVHVLARDGFAHTSARAVAQEAGTVNGSVFYYYGSMDGLLAATIDALAERGVARIGESLGGERAHVEWPKRLGQVLKDEAEGEDGRAVMELFVGSRTSPVLAASVRAAIDRAIDYATAQLATVLGDAPLTQVVPVPLLAEIAAATFLGIEVLAQNGRALDVDRVVALVATAVQLLAPPTPR
jgi:AcrR family transcriptional regulator